MNLLHHIATLEARLKAAEAETRKECGLILRQRAAHLRDQMLDGNIPTARELEAAAILIERDGASEAPLAESVWLHEVSTLQATLDEVRAERDELREAAVGLIQAIDDYAHGSFGEREDALRAALHPPKSGGEV